MRLSRAQRIFLLCSLLAASRFQIAAGAELLPLRASYSSIGGAFAPLWLAQDKGLFAKYGLAVELKYILSATGTQALFSGSIDIVNPATEIIEAGLAGQRVAFIVGILNRAVLSVYSKPELRQLSDLRGKVMGVTLPGSTTDLTAKILFQQAGLTPGKDVQVTHLQGMPDITTALTQGRIDAGVVSAPTTLKLRQAGFKELIDVAARNVPMIHAGLATTRDFIKNNPDKVRRYVQTWTKLTIPMRKFGKRRPTFPPRACRPCSTLRSIPRARRPSRNSSSTIRLSPSWTNPASSRSSTSNNRPRFIPAFPKEILWISASLRNSKR